MIKITIVIYKTNIGKNVFAFNKFYLYIAYFT